MTSLVTPRDGRLRVAVVAAAVLWVALYLVNDPWWTWLLRDALGVDLASRPGEGLHFFLYDTAKILLLLTGLMFVVGVLRASLDLERARTYLEGRGLAAGLALAVLLGVATPFCSCSSIPLFLGFVAAGIPLSVTLTFLVASPLVSEIAAIMIGDQFGWDVAAAYVVAGGGLAMLIGWVLSRFDLERWVEPMVHDTPVARLRLDGHVPTWTERVEAACTETRDVFTTVWRWVVAGVALGALIHGWVPEGFFVRYAQADNPFSVVVATLAGIPLYANGAGVVPIAEALWAKGVPLGSVMALVMSAITLSVPQAVMLRRVLRPPLLALFFGVVTLGILLIGFGFNLVYA